MTFARRALTLLALTWPLVLAPARARADVPRPPGWEPSCALDKELKRGGGPCEGCYGWRGEPDSCQDALQAKGYARRCKDGGAGSFVAIWCQGPAGSPAPPAVTPAPDNRRGCSVGPGAGAGAGLGALLALGIGLGAARRRSRRGRLRP